jgi:hypothetical protein
MTPALLTSSFFPSVNVFPHAFGRCLSNQVMFPSMVDLLLVRYQSNSNPCPRFRFCSDPSNLFNKIFDKPLDFLYIIVVDSLIHSPRYLKTKRAQSLWQVSSGAINAPPHCGEKYQILTFIDYPKSTLLILSTE